MIAFVHIAKTAGTTVKFILRNTFGLAYCNVLPLSGDGILRDGDLRCCRRFFPFLRCISGHGLIHPTAHLSESFRYFTFLRHPIERCISHYQHVRRARRRAGEDIDLEEFLARKAMHDHQVRKIAGGPDLERARRELREHYFFVGLAERFEESLACLAALCPLRLNLRHRPMHVARENSTKKAILEDPAKYRLVAAVNELDLELYEWASRELYPSLRERAGHPRRDDFLMELGRRTVPVRYWINRWYSKLLYRRFVKRASTGAGPSR